MPRRPYGDTIHRGRLHGGLIPRERSEAGAGKTTSTGGLSHESGNMKAPLILILTPLALASVAGCDRAEQARKDAVEAKADAMEEKADAVRKQSKAEAEAMKKVGDANAEVRKDTAQANAEIDKKSADQTAENLRKAGEAAAKNLEEQAKQTREQK